MKENQALSRVVANAVVPIEEAPIDKRTYNKGASKRRRYTMKEKYDIIERCEEAINDDELPEIKTPTHYFYHVYENHDEAHKFVGLYGKWNKPDHRLKMINEILGKNFAMKARQTRSPYHQMENKLYGEIVKKRKSGHRVSNTFIRLRALHIFNFLEEQGNPAYQTSFKASNGWRTNFIRRRNLKYRRRKSGKTSSADKHIPKFLSFLSRLRFDILVPRDGEDIDSIYGRFPPERRYNIDQVPLPFVVSQEFTFTLNEDTNIHITCPNETLRKRQWTMHLTVNAGEGENKDAWVDLVTKGTGTRVKAEEVSRYHPSVGMFWQKNAWVDGRVMVELAKKFVRKKALVHGDEWVLLYADNLSAHLLPEVKRIFGDAKVLVIYFPPSMTEMVQPIDAGYGRSLRAAIGRELDEWLMNADNLLKWEGKMTAMERRILVTHLVARAQEYMLADEAQNKARIGCFERTGCLITQVVTAADKLIQPQGVTVPFLVPIIPPPVNQDVEEEVETAEPNDRNMEQMASLFQEFDIEDAELILNDDIENDVVQEAEI